jgi:hypothetical protein
VAQPQVMTIARETMQSALAAGLGAVDPKGMLHIKRKHWPSTLCGETWEEWEDRYPRVVGNRTLACPVCVDQAALELGMERDAPAASGTCRLELSMTDALFVALAAMAEEQGLLVAGSDGATIELTDLGREMFAESHGDPDHPGAVATFLGVYASAMGNWGKDREFDPRRNDLLDCLVTSMAHRDNLGSAMQVVEHGRIEHIPT